jgi:hypothetical protein
MIRPLTILFISVFFCSCSESPSGVEKGKKINDQKQEIRLTSGEIIKSLEVLACQASIHKESAVYYSLSKTLTELVFDFVDTTFNQEPFPEFVMEVELNKLNAAYLHKIDSVSKATRLTLYPDKEMDKIKFSVFTAEAGYVSDFYSTCANILSVHQRFVEANVADFSHDPCKGRDGQGL